MPNNIITINASNLWPCIFMIDMGSILLLFYSCITDDLRNGKRSSRVFNKTNK